VFTTRKSDQSCLHEVCFVVVVLLRITIYMYWNNYNNLYYYYFVPTTNGSTEDLSRFDNLYSGTESDSGACMPPSVNGDLPWPGVEAVPCALIGLRFFYNQDTTGCFIYNQDTALELNRNTS